MGFLRKINEILSLNEKLKIAVIFALMFISGFLEALSISMVAGFIAVVANPEMILGLDILKKPLDFLGIETSQDLLIYGGIFLIAAFAAKNIYLLFFRYVKIRFINNRFVSISNRLFNIYMYVPYSFHLTHNSSNLIRNVSGETSSFVKQVLFPLLEISHQAIVAIGVMTLLIIAEPGITIATLIILGGVSGIFLKVTRNRIHYFGKRALKERGKLIRTLREGLGGFVDATIMGRQMWFVKKFNKSVKICSKAQIFTKITKKSIKPIMETVAVSTMFLIVFVFLHQGRSTTFLVSTLALFVLSFNRLLPAIDQIAKEYTSLRYYSYTLEPIHRHIMDFEKAVKQIKKQKNVERLHLAGAIDIKEVCYRYPESDGNVLEGISFSIPKGAVVGLVGATGGGKTTLVNLILGLLKPTGGVISVDGRDINENIRGWQRNIGYIPQFIYLSDDTITRNIAFGLEDKEIDQEKLKKAVEAAQLSDFVKSLPGGMETVIGERGVRLSGGQRQRVGIARALYNDPEVLIMDEATSSLDNITEKFIVEEIERLKTNRTVIIVAHRLTTVKNCDTIYFLDKGRVISQGNYGSLIENSSEFRAMAKGD